MSGRQALFVFNQRSTIASRPENEVMENTAQAKDYPADSVIGFAQRLRNTL